MSNYDVKFVHDKDPIFNMWLVSDDPDPHDDEVDMNYDNYLIYKNFGVKRIITPLGTQNFRYYEIVDEKQYFLSKIKYGF